MWLEHLSVLRLDRLAVSKMDSSDPQPCSLCSAGMDYQGQSQREQHVVPPSTWPSSGGQATLGRVTEICLIPLTKGQVFPVLRARKRPDCSEILHPMNRNHC